MNDLWNNTCVLFNEDKIVLSDPMLRGHNEAIKYCANSVGISVDSHQAMTDMMIPILENGNVMLLNAGRTVDENGVSKRTGYLALPEKLSDLQISNIENLIILLDDYKSITLWQLNNNKLSTVSMGDKRGTIIYLQEMISKVNQKEDFQK